MAKLPMVRLNLIAPFITQLQGEGADVTAPLRALGLSPAQVEGPEAFVTAAVMYQLVESLCEISCDPHIAVQVGESVNPLKWLPLSSASRIAETLFDALLLFAQDAEDSASSIEFSIHARPRRTTFRAVRLSLYGVTPRHNDAYTIGYLLGMMRTIIGKRWDGSRVLLSLGDPEVLPKKYQGCKQAKSDSLGVSIEFPTDWLRLSPGSDFSIRARSRAKRRPFHELNTLTAFRKILALHIHEKDLSLQKVANMFKISPSTVKRRLSEHDTTLGSELAQLREQRAVQMLRETDYPISTIAGQLGFSDASVFARSFRRWTGRSPSEIRQEVYQLSSVRKRSSKRMDLVTQSQVPTGHAESDSQP